MDPPVRRNNDGRLGRSAEDDTARDAWTLEDGCLRTVKNPKITEDLFSKRRFRDFELKFEWRISKGGNSGVKYRIQEHLFVHRPNMGERFEASVERSFVNRISARPERGQDYVVGFEYQITDDAANRDAMSNRKHTAGALYDMVAPSASPARPPGEFNETRIVVRGRHVEHWLNGTKVVGTALDAAEAMEGIKKRWRDAPHVLDLLSKQPVTLSPISLQNHGDDAWFRNIRIRELK